MSFLQSILAEDKKCLFSAQVRLCNRIRNHLPEYAVKNVWHQVREDAEVVEYLPDNEMDLDRMPDRRFFWGVLSTLRRDYVEEYVNQCLAQRDELHLIKRMETKTTAISEAWRERLAMHDFASRQKGK